MLPSGPKVFNGREDLRLRFPALSLWDVPIVEAAESVGYDCKTWTSLDRLIRAVRQAASAVIYPDRYWGQGKHRSSIYPDRWIPEQARAAKGISTAYKSSQPPACVPAFVLSVPEILNLASQAAPKGMSTWESSPSIPDKRDFQTANLHTAYYSTKRVKTGQHGRFTSSFDTSSYEMNIDSSSYDFDLYSDKATHISSFNSHKDQNILGVTQRQPLQSLGNGTASRPNSSEGAKKKKHKKNKSQSAPQTGPVPLPFSTAPPSTRETETVTLLSRVRAGLKSAGGIIGTNRYGLKQQWDADHNLQLHSVTNKLVKLNERFTTIEDTVDDAVTVLQMIQDELSELNAAASNSSQKENRWA